MSEDQKTYYSEEELEIMAQAAYDNNFTHILHAHVDIAGDLVAGALLSQILFWFAPDKNGNSKLRIFKDGHYWLVKERTDWWNEIRITERQYDRAIKDLEKRKLIIKKRYKFKGNPTTHLRPNFEVYHAELEKWKNNVKKMIVEGGNSNLHFVRKPVKSRGSTESDTKNATEEQAVSLENQGEAPNPASDLEFTESVKTELHNGEIQTYTGRKNGFTETGNSLTEITNRDYNTKITTRDHLHTETTLSSVVVVVGEEIKKYKDMARRFFGNKVNNLSNEEWLELILLANDHGKDLEEALFNTYCYFASTEEPIKNLVGAINHEITNGWRVAITIKRVFQNLYSSFQEQQAAVPENFSFYDWVNQQK
ncbi:hypothetical protein [Thermoactinomyces sp. CICC 10521]|uniref:hypothetical protein n=1 Tax=Thermoactinomyces sp. CICC 10521 TaxID=2767426 RepID=UPI0018DE6866|nr:hypothetical protein [Thermoactinomyces sp. CICC 10521]MBH8608771.1 hypothetical protein [Thermoactinomyces sp. CICC 10521]